MQLVTFVASICQLVQVKSLELLEQADCVVYDDLASQQGLSRCKPGAELVYVGKRGGTPSPKQPEICQLLVKKCGEFDNVCYYWQAQHVNIKALKSKMLGP